MQVLWGFGGKLVLLTIAVLLSTNWRAINPRTVVCALIIQSVSAFVVLCWDFGRRVLRSLTNGVRVAIDSSNAGIESLSGPVLSSQGAGLDFAFHVLPRIIFFATLMSVLYCLGVLQFVVNGLGRGLQQALGTTAPRIARSPPTSSWVLPSVSGGTVRRKLRSNRD